MKDQHHTYFRLNQYETIGFQDYQLSNYLLRIVHIKHDVHSFKSMYLILLASKEHVVSQTDQIVKQRMISKL